MNKPLHRCREGSSPADRARQAGLWAHVQAHGGIITARSFGEQTVFTVTLPHPTSP